MTADIRLCFVGDSFVNGTGDDDCLGWTGRVCQRLRRAGCEVTGYNLGVRRDTSADIAARWRGEVARRLPTHVTGRLVFSFGVNDATVESNGPRVALTTSRLHLQSLLRSATHQYETLVVGPPPVDERVHNERIAELSAVFAGVCAGEGVPYLAVFSALQRSDIWRTEVRPAMELIPTQGVTRSSRD
jgi:acyl-CoA thioesterase-1